MLSCLGDLAAIMYKNVVREPIVQEADDANKPLLAFDMYLDVAVSRYMPPAIGPL